jgi:GR25 family glycosyltransferase involved in LPS biosynthesis
MKIDLKNIKKICISLSSEIEKRTRFSKLMNTLEYKNWEYFDAIKTNDPIEGCALSQIEVLRKNLNDEPILILEDDVNSTEWCQNELTILDSLNTDAIYLGYSWWAWDASRASMSTLPAKTKVIKTEDNFYKISNMTSAHAIVYITEQYKSACADAAEEYLKNPNGIKHCDVPYALLQNNYNVYATPKHYFYQQCPRNEYWTNMSIN